MIEGTCLCGRLRWRCKEMPDAATACNCTACRRYGVLWAYGHENEDIWVSGDSRAYAREKPSLEFHFCATCGCVGFWRGVRTNSRGQRRIAVNLRLANPAEVGAIIIDHFDGLDSFEDLPRDGRCVADMWF